VSIKSIKILFK